MDEEIQRLRDELIAACDERGVSFAIMVQEDDGFNVSYDVDHFVVPWAYHNKWEAMCAALKASMADDIAENDAEPAVD